MLALRPRKRFAEAAAGNTITIADGGYLLPHPR
jgi:hypothetical protein